MPQYTEDFSSLSQDGILLAKAFVSLKEEIEAASYYIQRLDNCECPELKEILLHNMLEEVEHANKIMGWINNNNVIDIKYEPMFSAEETAKEITDLVNEKNNESADSESKAEEHKVEETKIEDPLDKGKESLFSSTNSVVTASAKTSLNEQDIKNKLKKKYEENQHTLHK
jgi:hypothetical protein